MRTIMPLRVPAQLRFFNYVPLARNNFTASVTSTSGLSRRRLLSLSRPYGTRRPAVPRSAQVRHRNGVFRQFNSSKSSSSSSSSSSTEHLSISQRFGKLSREYGWSALGVYLLLSALDFPLCFAAMRLFGVERIAHLEHVIVGSIKNALAYVVGSGQHPAAEPEPLSPELEKAMSEQKGDDGDTEPSMYFTFFFFFFFFFWK